MRTSLSPYFARSLFGSLAVAALLLSTSGDAWAGATGSAFKKESKRGSNFWNAQAAIDGDPGTAWMVPGESPNRGEWIMLDVPKSTVDKIGMVVGWAKSDVDFADYARVKTVQVEVFSYDESQDLKPLSSAKLEFKDTMEMQVVDMPDVVIDDMFGGKVKLSIVDVYPGKDYANFAMSEVVVHLGDFDAVPMITEVSGEDKARENMVDDNKNTFWLADTADAAVSFEAKGYSLSQVGVQTPGKDYDRPKKIEVTANGRSTVQNLPDKPGALQWILIPAITGYTGSAWGQIDLKVLETYPGSRTPGKIAISELDLKATAYEGI